jgi:hypothetical protein
MHPKSNDSPRELIHDEEDPVRFEHHGFAPEQINAPKTVFHMTDEGEPGGPILGIWPIFPGENAPYDILIDIDAKGPYDLLRDPGGAEPGIPLFHL